MLDGLTMTNPLLIAWEDWCAGVVTDLGTVYNIPNPVNEDSWQQWAVDLLNIDAIAELGVPDPRPFGTNWRQWAAAFLLSAA